MKGNRWSRWALAMAVGLAWSMTAGAAATSVTTDYRLVNSLFEASNERIYFIGNEVFFSNSVDTLVLASPSGKYKRTLRGITYPLAVSSAKLYTIRDNYIDLVDTKNGKLKKLIDISSLKIDQFAGGSTSQLSETTRVLSDFQFGDNTAILSVYYSIKNGCMLTTAYSLKNQRKLWERNSCDDRSAPYGTMEIFPGYFSARASWDTKYYSIKTGQTLDTAKFEHLRSDAYFRELEDIKFKGIPCRYGKQVYVICSAGNKMTTYTVKQLVGTPPFDYLKVVSK